MAAHLISQRLANDSGLSKFFAGTAAELRKGQFMGLMMAIFKDDIDAADNVARQIVSVSGFSDQHFDKLVALIDNHDYAIGETFKSVEGSITLQEITKKRIIFAKETDQGTQKYVMKFRKKKGALSRGKRTKRGGRQRRSR